MPESPEGLGGTLLFVGCTFSLDRSLFETPKALASIMEKVGDRPHILLEDEICCGSTTRRLGDEGMFQQLRDANCERILSIDPKRIVTPCAGCYKTLTQDYGEMLPGIEVLHSTEYLLGLLRDERLELSSLDESVTYHDPSHLGRYAGIYDEPREILGYIPGLKLVEMKNSRELSMCCGGGGGVKTAYANLSDRIARKRVMEAEGTGASILVTACPFCVQSLSAATASLGSRIAVKEISILVDRLSTGKGGDV